MLEPKEVIMDVNYTVLARKYRSQDFESLIGQDVLVKTLTTAINTGRIAHAYIFTGIRGTGKADGFLLKMADRAYAFLGDIEI